MNQNFMKSSFKVVAAALVASLAFTSCSKDQFTEKDALNLELSRLRAQRSIDSIKTQQDRTDRNALLRYQRALDSLDRENAGGRVFYTVNVISATASAVAGGRTEEAEGVTGATVTTSQYGNVVSKTTQSGIATFELRSGEATVAVVAPAHTSADYTVNLTAPFSGGAIGNTGIGAAQTAAPVTAAKNGTTVYVGNVLPLFQISTDGASMATIRGRVFIETDLTNDVEELANTQNAAIQAAGTVANIFVSAGINSNNATFYNRYLAKNNNQFATSGNNLGGTSGVSTGNNTTSTGAAGGLGVITKLFYGPAVPATGSGSAGAPVNRVAVSATGDYTILVPATVSGLPTVIKSDELFAQRTYFRSDALGLGTLTTQRFIYGPEVTADAVDLGASIPRVSFQAFTTPATVTASYTAEVVSTSFTTGGYTAAAGGFFAVTPSVAVAGTTGTGLTAGNTGNAPTGSVATATTNGAFVNVAANAFANLPTASTTAVGLSVSGVEISAGGTGYVAVAGPANDGVASFTRTDVVAVGSGFRVAGATGSQISSFIQVTDGGFGFIYPVPANYVVATRTGGFSVDLAGSFTTSGFTGTLPTVSFGNILAPALSPVALVIPEPTIGTITSIQVTNPGSGLASIPQPVFTYGTTGGLPPTDAAGDPLFRQAGAGGIQFNPSAAIAPAVAAGLYDMPAGWGAVGTDYTFSPTNITLTPTTAAFAAAQATTLGSGYVFVPTAVASATGGGAYPSITPANFTVSVRTSSTFAPTNAQGGLVPQGAIQRIDISAPGNYTAAGLSGAAGVAITFPLLLTTPANLGTGIALTLVAPSVPTGSSRSANSLAALSFAGGSGLALDNYVISTPTPQVTRGGVTPAAAANIFTAATASGYPSNVTLVTSTLLNPNTFITPALASNLLAGSAWIVAFDAPTGGGTQAWGIPYIDLVNGVSTISGVRVMDAGAGYPATTTAVPMTLMPNPFRNNTASVTGGAIALSAMGPVNADNFFNVTATNIQVKANTSLVSALSGASTIGFELPAVGASLTFTVTNTGSGYATAPRVVIADGGLTFGAIAAALNPTLVGGSAGSTDVGPVVMIGSATSGAGATLKRVGALVGTAATGATPEVGRITFAVGSDPKFLSNPAVFVIDNLSNALTNAYNNAVALGAGTTFPIVGGPYNGFNKADLPAITIGANGAIIGLGSAQTAANQSALGMSKLPERFVVSDAWPAVGYHTSPVVTIAAPATGTAATAVIDPAAVETATTVGGIRATGTNGVNAVTGVTAVTAVAGTAGVTEFVINGGVAGGTVQVISGALVPTITSSTGAVPTIGAAVGTGAGANYTITIAANIVATVRVTAAVVAVGANPAPTATAGAITGTATFTSGPTGTAGTTGVAGVTGVGAVTLVAGLLPGEIQAIRLTSGGSGYGRGNLYQRWFTLNNGINQTAANGQDYVIIGSNISNAVGGAAGPQLGVTGSQFDVMTGVTYARDIHYGTGQRID